MASYVDINGLSTFLDNIREEYSIESIMGASSIGSTSAYPYWTGSSWATQSLSNYALKSAIPTALSDLSNDVGYITASALSGYATQSWVEGKGYITASAIPSSYAWSAITGKPNTLSGYGITDAYTASTIDNKLSGYLPLSGGTMTGIITLKGEQNTGNYGINASNSDIVNLNAIYTADLANSGIEGIQFARSNGNYDSLWAADGVLYFSPNGNNSSHTGSYATNYTLIHSGNIGSQSVTYASNAGQLGGYDITSVLPQILQSYRYIAAGTDLDALTHANAGWWNSIDNTDYTNGPKQNFGLLSARINSSYFGQLVFGYSSSNLMYRSQYYNGGSIVWSDWKTIAFTESNVASATKLQTARTLWGQSFDGTADVSGNITLGKAIGANLSDTWTDNNGNAHPWYGLDFTHLGTWTTLSSFYGVALKTANGSIYLNYSGNVGIGTSSPSEKLTVLGNILLTKMEGNTSAGDILFQASPNVNGFKISSVFTNWASRQDLVFYSSNNTADPYTPSWSETMRITHTGLVGIGTTSPAYKLDVNGTARCGKNEDGADLLVFKMDREWRFQQAGTGGAAALVLRTLEDGKSFHLRNNAKETAFTYVAQNGANRLFAYCPTAINSTLTVTGAVTMSSNLSVAGNIVASGEVTALGSSSSSDRRLKDIVSRPTPLTLEDIAKLNIISFTWNHRDNDKRLKLGLIAQEVKEVMPELVGVDRSNYYTLDYSTFGSVVGVMNTKEILLIKKELEALKKENKELRRAIYG